MVNRGVIQDDGLNGRIERGNFYSRDELDTGLCNGKEYYYDSHLEDESYESYFKMWRAFVEYFSFNFV